MTISPDRLENLRSRIERAEDAAKHLENPVGILWAERYAGDVTFLLGQLAAPSPGTGTAAVSTEPMQWTVCTTCGGPDLRVPAGPAPEPVKPPATWPETWPCVSCGNPVNRMASHVDAKGFVLLDYGRSCPPSTGRTPAAGTAPKGGR